MAVAAKREDLARKEKIAASEVRERDRRADQRSDDARKDAEADDLMAFVLATPEDIAAFRVQLDEYDTATVEALTSNEQSLKAVREKIDAMLQEAHVLPDGRRVFKTMDGQRVFDENGQPLSPDIIDPDSIDDRKTKWETFQQAKDEHARLNEQRQQLLDYQAKLDEARERLGKGEITKQELEGIKADLAADMPDTVREKLGIEQPRTDVASKQDADLKEAVQTPDMDALMQQTGFGPATPKL